MLYLLRSHPPVHLGFQLDGVDHVLRLDRFVEVDVGLDDLVEPTICTRDVDRKLRFDLCEFRGGEFRQPCLDVGALGSLSCIRCARRSAVTGIHGSQVGRLAHGSQTCEPTQQSLRECFQLRIAQCGHGPIPDS